MSKLLTDGRVILFKDVVALSGSVLVSRKEQNEKMMRQLQQHQAL